MMKKLLTFVFALILLGQVNAQRSFSMQEAVDYALENSLSVRNAQLNIADAEQQIIERRSAGLPKASGSFGYNYYIDIPTNILPPFVPEQALTQVEDINGEIIPISFTQLDAQGMPIFGEPQEVQFGLKHNATAGIQLQSLLFDWTYLTGLKAAREYRNYVQLELAEKKAEVGVNVVNAYMPSLILQENLNIIDSNIVNLERLKFETNESYKAGFVEQLDVDRLTLSLANIQVQRDALVRQLENTKSALKMVLNYPMNEEIVIADNIKDLLEEPPVDHLTGNIDPTIRVEYALIEQGLALSELNIQANQAGYYPSLFASLAHQRQFQGDKLSEGNWFPITVAGFQLNVPIFDGFGRKSKIQRARLDLEKATNQKTQFEQGVVLEVTMARADYLSAKERVENQQANLELAQRIYNTSKIKYKEGVGSSLELSSAEQQLYQTQQGLITAQYDLLRARIDLGLALGK